MPKKNKPPNSKSQVSPRQKLIKESRQQAKRDLTDQWRFLKKIGAYQTKSNPAESRLTDSRARAIKSKMREIQKQKKFTKGKVISPVLYGARKTRGGNIVYDYHLNPYFDFIRTKNKPSATEGVQKVGRGYIIEKTRPNSRLSVTKKGDIVEIMGKEKRTRKRYRGRDLLKLLDQWDKGTYKFQKHDFFVLHMWGSPNEAISSWSDGVSLLYNYIKELENSMGDSEFKRFINETYIEKIKMIDG